MRNTKTTGITVVRSELIVCAESPVWVGTKSKSTLCWQFKKCYNTTLNFMSVTILIFTNKPKLIFLFYLVLKYCTDALPCGAFNSLLDPGGGGGGGISGVLRDTVSFVTALTWTLVLSIFEKRLPRPKIISTRRIHLEIRFNFPSILVDFQSFTENLFLSMLLLILWYYFITFG